jgi:hypothetical protein
MHTPIDTVRGPSPRSPTHSATSSKICILSHRYFLETPRASGSGFHREELPRVNEKPDPQAPVGTLCSFYRAEGSPGKYIPNGSQVYAAEASRAAPEELFFQGEASSIKFNDC